MRFADFMNTAGIIKDTLGCCSFTGIDMRHDTDVTSLF
ncbi:hypothetical protein B4098_1155 [Heyndrickxia coagulans]|uniref:Uncharacterized protein n=1 Tax=Heyndrickxia coagulans TaxID=1398 RepID=A0A150KFM4_HEYCO|nr:hypothetical protein B4098_1155 [Heyndrickxia coagulans]KYC69932.1 hypothetical protein B4099_1289 [Heyndrickxia coagulans]